MLKCSVIHFPYLKIVYSFNGTLSKSDNRMLGRNQNKKNLASRDITYDLNLKKVRVTQSHMFDVVSLYRGCDTRVCCRYYGSSIRCQPRANTEIITAEEPGPLKIDAVLILTSVSLEREGML